MNPLVSLVNQVFEIEQKIAAKNELADVSRNIDRIKNHLDELGYQYHNPINEKYMDTRTDCVASIVGDLVDSNMFISKVIKPVIYFKNEQAPLAIVQKAVVIVEHRK